MRLVNFRCGSENQHNPLIPPTCYEVHIRRRMWFENYVNALPSPNATRLRRTPGGLKLARPHPLHQIIDEGLRLNF